MTTWNPTHTIRWSPKANTRRYLHTDHVMLTEDGAAYTSDEWDAEAPGDFHRDGGTWTMQGEAFNGTVEPLPLIDVDSLAEVLRDLSADDYRPHNPVLRYDREDGTFSIESDLYPADETQVQVGGQLDTNLGLSLEWSEDYDPKADADECAQDPHHWMRDLLQQAIERDAEEREQDEMARRAYEEAE